ncbi:hypothetical protein [Serratia silvae]|uniref:Uncharacterized protein n=1 Tax=Serratia silvae TaxID=2824122 RepID=A0ABT0K768_9GAMM|nr:hypothetical protein [Serratia silvae]MCL1027873.1 hypothetical protein [Serratia silvae]
MAAYFRTRSHIRPLSWNDELYVVQGQPLAIKVHGLGPNRQHLTVRAIRGNVSVRVIRADNNNIEQDIEVSVVFGGQDELRAYVSQLDEDFFCDAAVASPMGCIHPLKITAYRKLDFPPNISADELALLRVFLSETITPEKPTFNLEDAVRAMQYMRQVIYNRMAFSHPQYFNIARGNLNLFGVIGARGQIDGFGDYPNIDARSADRISKFMIACNRTGMGEKLRSFRQLYQGALDVATGNNPGIQHIPPLYSWRTAGQGSPGSNFQTELSLQGQTFFSLTPAFISDPNGRK